MSGRKAKRTRRDQRDGRGPAESKPDTSAGIGLDPERMVNAEGYLLLVDGTGSLVLGADPEHDLLDFVSNLGAFQVIVVATLDKVNKTLAHARLDDVNRSFVVSVQPLVKHGAVPWPAARALLPALLADVRSAYQVRDEEATIDGLLRMHAWVDLARDLWQVSQLDWDAACRKVTAFWNQTLMAAKA